MVPDDVPIKHYRRATCQEVFSVNPSLTLERLHELLTYDPETGHFTWRATRSPNGKANAGSRAGSLKANGYRQLTIDCVKYKEHRLARFYVTGEWPASDVDHKATKAKDDNRFGNLRDASRSQNRANTDRQVNNSSGFKGVRRNRKSGRWVASIKVRGRKKHLGTFDAPEAAHAAYCAAAAQYFGEFANHGA